MPPSGATANNRKRSNPSSSNNNNMTSKAIVPGASTVYACSFGGASQTRIQPQPQDVLSGRGGSINSHEGNTRFREWVRVRKNAYTMAKTKEDKAMVAKEVIDLVYSQNPPGRFLHKDPSSAGSGWWFELDKDKILAKTAQALREGAPKIRAELQRTPVVQHRTGGKKRSNIGNAKRKGVLPPSQLMSTLWQHLGNEAIANVDAEMSEAQSFQPQPVLPVKLVRMEHNGAIVRPNDETPPLLPSASTSELMRLPQLSLPPPQANAAERLPRSHSLALSDISVSGDWANEEFVNPFESESDISGAGNGNGGGKESGNGNLQREVSSSSSLSTMPKPAQFIIGASQHKPSESNGDMAGIGALLKSEDSNDEAKSSNKDEVEPTKEHQGNGASRTVSEDGHSRYDESMLATH
ncbi:hypothetical protein MPSEU_000409500 [Mayamaea pseudoterrestris]|nr:hypothetical protein MPSEU_000409500 [Mayamaea pseudoterrestris]